MQSGPPLLLPRKKAGTLHGYAMLGAGFSLLTCAEVGTVVTVAGRVDAMDLAVCMVVMWWCVWVWVWRETQSVNIQLFAEGTVM
eukprot:m.55308 g.55308  ORF g.55308 m.55308 type:complete len:84 (+) comp16875_c0_seq1:2662-2913(+)